MRFAKAFMLLGAAILLCAGQSAQDQEGRRHRADVLRSWTTAQTKSNCEALAGIAVRRAAVVSLEFRGPPKFEGGAWTASGTARLQGAPRGLKSAPFSCVFSRDGDLFDIQPISLTFGP